MVGGRGGGCPACPRGRAGRVYPSPAIGEAGEAQAGAQLHPCLQCEPWSHPPHVPQFPHPYMDAVCWGRGCERSLAPCPPGSRALF